MCGFGMNQQESEGYFSSQETNSDNDKVGLSFEFKRIMIVLLSSEIVENLR